jgi:hypothetical protein
MRNVSRDDRSSRWRVARASLFALALFAIPLEAQDGRFEVLTIPPASAGTCLPPLLKPLPGATIRPGNRLVIKSVEPGSSREISTMFDEKSQAVVFSDRSSITRQSVQTEGALITAIIQAGGEFTGFRIETALTVPDSVLQMQDIAAIQSVIAASTGTIDRRDLDSAEQQRVRSMLEFIRKRCP